MKNSRDRCSRLKWFMPLVVLLLLVPLPVWAQQGGILWTFEAGARVDAATMSDDGQRVAFGARDDKLRVFNTSGEIVTEFEAENSILGADMSADGQWLAVASEDRFVYLLDVDGEVIWQHKAGSSMLDAAVADDGSLVAASSRDRSFYILNGEGDLVLHEVVGMDVKAVAIYGTGDMARVIVGADDGSVSIYSREGKQLLETNLGYDVHAVDVTPNGRHIVAGCRDGNVYYLDGSNGDVLWTYQTGGVVQSVALSADDRTVLIGADDNKAYLVDQEGNFLQEIHQEDEVISVAISADGSRLALGTVDNKGLVVNRHAAQQSYQQSGTRRLVFAGSLIGGLGVLIAASTYAVRHTETGRRVWESRSARPRAFLGNLWQARISYLMILPTITLLLVFNYYPAFSGLGHAFTEWNPGASTEWVGLENFRYLLHDRFFIAGMKNVVILVIVNLLKSLTMPLLVAELIFNLRNHFTRYWFRSIFIAPLVLPGVVLTLLWNNIYDPTIGLLNQSLIALGLEGLTRTWYGDPSTALASILFIGFPWVAPFAMLIYYGGLISIPNELFDAGQVDGATGLKRFWNIDLPLLTGQVKLLAMLAFMNSVQAFQIIYLTTGGGPGCATYTPVLELYYLAMRMSKFGVASAAGILLFIIIMVGTVLNMRLVKSSTEYEA